MATGLFDNHAHMGPRDAVDAAAARQQTGFPKNPPDAIYSADSNLEAMDRLGIERRVLSLPPLLYGYELEASAQPEHCRYLNDWIVEATEDDRLLPMGLLPLGAPEAVSEELDRCIDQLGMHYFAIGTHVDGAHLDDLVPDPVWQRLGEAGALVMLHPWNQRDIERLDAYGLDNTLGIPFETAVAAARLIGAGVMTRHDNLNIMLAHGGGALMGVLDRMDKAWMVFGMGEKGPKPSDLARKFYYDTVVFAPEHLQFLGEFAGPDHLLFGTDSPFGMGIDDPESLFAAAGVSVRDTV
jgi:aminocarboxymuconate-semialdehyde decarboxylase